MHETSHITLSIILPTLNAGKTISGALDSLASQSYSNFEVLIRDGGSTDNTLHEVGRYTANDSRFHCVSERDNGIYDAMNKAILDAKGEWIFFLGGDDSLYDSNVFSDIINSIYQSPAVKLVYGNVQLNEPLGYHHEELIYAGQFDSAKLLKKNICHQSAFYHRSLFQRFGLFRTEYTIFADYDFNLRCFNKIESLYLDRIIANFNVGGHSKNKQSLDQLFERDFTANMVLHYSFPYKSSFFNGKKKELFHLLLKRFGLRQMKGTVNTCKILSYQTLKSLTDRRKSILYAKQNN